VVRHTLRYLHSHLMRKDADTSIRATSLGYKLLLFEKRSLQTKPQMEDC